MSLLPHADWSLLPPAPERSAMTPANLEFFITATLVGIALVALLLATICIIEGRTTAIAQRSGPFLPVGNSGSRRHLSSTSSRPGPLDDRGAAPRQREQP